MHVCVCLCRTGSVLPSGAKSPTAFVSEVVQTVTQLILLVPALHCAVPDVALQKTFGLQVPTADISAQDACETMSA